MKVVTGIALAVLLTSSAHASLTLTERAPVADPVKPETVVDPAKPASIVILPVGSNPNPVIDARLLDPTPLEPIFGMDMEFDPWGLWYQQAAMDSVCSDPASLAVTTGACSWMTEDHWEKVVAWSENPLGPTMASKPDGIGSDYVASPPAAETPVVATPLPRRNPLKDNAKATPKRQHANPSIN